MSEKLEGRDTDEAVSWRWAGAIMTVTAILTLITSILGIDRFALVFDIFIIYIPTVVLLGSIIFQRLRHPAT